MKSQKTIPCSNVNKNYDNANSLEKEALVELEEMTSELGLFKTDLSKTQHVKEGQTNVILKGVGGAVLVILANLIILAYKCCCL